MNNPLKPTAEKLISKFGGQLKATLKALDDNEFKKMEEWIEQLKKSEYERRGL